METVKSDLQSQFDEMKELLGESIHLTANRHTGQTHEALLATNKVVSRLIDIVSDLVAQPDVEPPGVDPSPPSTHGSAPRSPSRRASSPSKSGSAGQ
ncbi:MAG: hypothetical protein OXG74_11970 [Acidobacteria bacterium]|nr:hypothetical protein [Acidobacteriota bacterium]